jgi:hypothetical protein
MYTWNHIYMMFVTKKWKLHEITCFMSFLCRIADDFRTPLDVVWYFLAIVRFPHDMRRRIWCSWGCWRRSRNHQAGFRAARGIWYVVTNVRSESMKTMYNLHTICTILMKMYSCIVFTCTRTFYALATHRFSGKLGASQTVCRRNLSVACCEFKSLKSLEPLGLNHLDDVLHSALEADECADVQVESTWCCPTWPDLPDSPKMLNHLVQLGTVKNC